jgi:hypothetical protein
MAAQQMALFPETNPMLDELKALDVNSLSPIEALNKLYEWQLLKWNSQPYFSLMQGKRAALLVTCGDGVENNADLIQIIFKRQMACLQTEVAGSYILPHCTLEKARGVEGAQLANQMASELLI